MKKNVLYPVLVILSVLTSKAAPNASQENIVAQMNYCMNAMTNIIEDQSMVTLQHESDQILNNLTMEGIAGLWEIQDFRSNLIEALGKFTITAEERQLTKRIQSIRRDNMKWQALSNALSPTMVMTSNRYSGAFNILTTAARSIIEYNVARGEQSIEELRENWNLREQDLTVIKELRREAHAIIYDLFTKYHLKESQRLTEESSKEFHKLISEKDCDARIRKMNDKKGVYAEIAEYYYYLGMAYLDNGNYALAKDNFDKYLRLYSLAPIFRHDEMSGCIALAKLSNEQNLSHQQKQNFIDIALNNLPGNSPAVLQCALEYFQMKEFEKGYQLIRSGIDDPNASDRSLLLMAAINLLPQMKSYNQTYTDVIRAIGHLSSMDSRSFFTYVVNANSYAWSKGNLVNLVSFENIGKMVFNWHSLFAIWGGNTDRKLDCDISIVLPMYVSYNQGDFRVYIEEHGNDELIVQELKVNYKDAVSIEKVNKVDCFKSNMGLKYLFLTPVDKDEQSFMVKPNLDYEKIKNGEMKGMQKYTLSDDDREDIIDFCKDNYKERNNLVLECEEIDSEETDMGTVDGVKLSFIGNNLLYKPHHNDNMIGCYLRIVFDNNICIMYKYEHEQRYFNDKDTLSPYLYYLGNRYVFRSEKYLQEYVKGISYHRMDVKETKKEEDVMSGINAERMDSITKWIKEGLLGISGNIINTEK